MKNMNKLFGIIVGLCIVVTIVKTIIAERNEDV